MALKGLLGVDKDVHNTVMGGDYEPTPSTGNYFKNVMVSVFFFFLTSHSPVELSHFNVILTSHFLSMGVYVFLLFFLVPFKLLSLLIFFKIKLRRLIKPFKGYLNCIYCVDIM